MVVLCGWVWVCLLLEMVVEGGGGSCCGYPVLLLSALMSRRLHIPKGPESSEVRAHAAYRPSCLYGASVNSDTVLDARHMRLMWGRTRQSVKATDSIK